MAGALGDGWVVARLAATAAIRGGLWRKLAPGIDRRSGRRATMTACLARRLAENDGLSGLRTMRK